MSDEWKVVIQFQPEQLSDVIYVFRKLGDKTEYLVNGGKEMMLIDRTGIKTDADLSFARLLDNDILTVLAEALDKKGIQPPKRPFIEGKLEATESHLQDMRKLVFKDKI